jgi:glucan phosphoethanolaminetransferase (alkaline phosphatase superfamily)
MFFTPVAEMIYETGEIFAFNLTGFYQTEAETTITLSNQYSIMLLGILICVLNVIAIFMYKSRVLQMRLCVYNMLLLAGLMGIVLFVLYSVPNVRSVSYSMPAVFPIISLILHYLAFRGIRRDDMMVQALSRLR